MGRSISKDFFRYVSTNVLGMIGLSCYIFADTLFVARGLGTNGLAALNLSISMYGLIYAGGLMIGIGGATRFAILKARGQIGQARTVFTHAMVAGIVLGLVFLSVGLLFSEQLSVFLGADAVIFEMTNTYLRTILLFGPAFVVNSVLLAFVRNDGNPNLAMAGMLTSSFGNILLDYILIFPLQMGMFGAALATGIASVIGIFLLLLHFRGPCTLRLQGCRFQFRYLRDMAALGLSTFITEISGGLVLVVFNLTILGIAGNVGVAAYGVVANLAFIAMSIFTGIGQGLQPLASYSHGRGEPTVLRRILFYGLITVMVTAGAIYLLVLGFSDEIVAAFNRENNVELARYAKEGLLIYFTGFIFAGANVVGAGYCAATERTALSFVISITRGAVAIIPLVLILARCFGMVGVWLSFPGAEMVTFMVGVALASRNRWTQKTTADGRLRA
ncbi:MAG TPA: MATE family efflux transporter [Firmicutes bacterium]|nr:MATE family efflux transporter [Bacillota bacterium]